MKTVEDCDLQDGRWGGLKTVASLRFSRRGRLQQESVSSAATSTYSQTMLFIMNAVLVSDFDFPLDDDLIAQEPLPDRSASRMLHLSRTTSKFEDLKFASLPDLLRPDDLLVVNNSRVFPARLFGRRSGLHAQPVSPRNPASRDFLHGQVEVLLTRQVGDWKWQALVRPGRKLGVGEKISFAQQGDESPEVKASPELEALPQLEAKIIARGDFGERTLLFTPVADFFATLEKLGHVPLPPYIAREDRSNDRERYQTVYARPEARGSVAAPLPDCISRLKFLPN